jgi:hypothetical protein
MSRTIRLMAAAGAVIALGGCMERDPYRRQDVWHPTGANAANIAAMVADPKDLIAGRGVRTAPAQPAVMAIERVNADRPRRLIGPTSGGTADTPTGGGAGASGAGAGG